MINFKDVELPKKENDLMPVILSKETMIERKNNVLCRMKKIGFDALVIYADLEHGSNFEYLTGFLPRFEEALLILFQDGSSYMVLGNENLNKAAISRIETTAIHMPHFSLPNQPMNTDKSVSEILSTSGLNNAKSIGLVGWKNFTSKYDNNANLYDLPYYIVHAMKNICKDSKFSNATYVFIGENGVRTINNADEIAHYEFGAAIAGNCILNTMETIDVGMSEMQVAEKLSACGQHHNVVSIMATGRRFENANLYPTGKIIKIGDKISMSTGYKGGLQSRSGYAVKSVEELPEDQKNYLSEVAKPYFTAVKIWLETIHIGMRGNELYDYIEKVLPKQKYGWSLNPGHLCADEEWMSSPIYPKSKEELKSGMLLQIDIIPSVPGYCGASCESGVVLADKELRKAIKNAYPLMWKRMQERRQYIIEVLGIQLSEDILPTSNATAFYNPFFLNKRAALICTD